MMRSILLYMMIGISLLSAETSFDSGSKEMTYARSCEHQKDITIAVATVEMSNKSARLVFQEDGIQNRLSLAIKNSGCYRVVDWKHLKDVIARHQLEWSDIVEHKESRAKLQKILAVDYFLISSISSYSSDVEYSNSTFSKEKTQNVSLEMDLILKNALTNEYVTTVSTKGFASKKVEQSLGFGTAANSSAKVSNLALARAIDDGVKRLAKRDLKKITPSSSSADSGGADFIADIDLDNISDSMKRLVANSNSSQCPGKWIKTTGVASMDKGRYQAKKRATMDAYRSAVSIGSGVKIDSFSQLNISDSMSHAYSVISKKSSGFISYYDIVSQTRRGDDLEVGIKACVVDTDISSGDTLQGLRQFVSLIGSPTLLLVLGQEKMDATTNKDRLQIRTVEVAMGEFFQKLGYTIILSDDLVGRGLAKAEKIRLARQGVGGNAIELARAAGADMLITGNILFAMDKTKISDATAKAVSASLNAKLMMPGSAKVVSLYNKQGRSMDLTDNTLSSREKIIKRTALDMAYTMAWDIPKYLLEEEREIELVINDVSYKTLRKLLKALKQEKEVLDIRDGGRWRKTHGKLGRTWIIITTSFFGIDTDAILDILERYGMEPELELVSDYYSEISIGK